LKHSVNLMGVIPGADELVGEVDVAAGDILWGPRVNGWAMWFDFG
jgi:hypothetical protein